MRTKSTLLCVILIVFFSLVTISGSQAQCTYKVVNMANNTASYTIPCDFPIKANTGDSTLDQDNFLAAFKTWNLGSESIKEKLLPTVKTTGILYVYFEITAAEYATYTEERKTAMAAYPALYKVLP